MVVKGLDLDLGDDFAKRVAEEVAALLAYGEEVAQG